MNRTLLGLLVVAFATFSMAHEAEAQKSFAEVQAKSNVGPNKGLTLITNLHQPVHGQWGLNVYFMTLAGWAEGYVGPTLTLSGGKLILNTSFGVEQGEDGFQPRYAMLMAANHGKLSFVGTVEGNNDTFRGDDKGLWYELVLKYQLTGKLFTGLKDKRPSGVGPFVQYKLTKNTGVGVTWYCLGSETLDWQPDRFVFAVRHMF